MGTSFDRTKQNPIQWFPLGICSIFFLLELNNIVHHPMWRDELQVWMLARHSHSISELIHLKRYEGHPDAWYLLIYFVQRFSTNPRAMQLLHLFIASATAYVVARYAPFTRIHRALLVFGYFLLFEYATISRAYALGVFCVFGFCAVFGFGLRKNYVLLAVLLALLAQTSAYGLILALSFSLGILVEAISGPSTQHLLPPNDGRALLAAFLFLASVSLSVVHLIPKSDRGGEAMGWNVNLNLSSIGYTLTMLSRSFLPIPQLSRQFWNTHVLHGPAEAMLSIVILCFSVLFFIRKPIVLLTYCSGLAAMFILRCLKPSDTHYLRHDGHAFILFVACVWLASICPEESFALPCVDRIAKRFAPYQCGALLGLFAVHAAVGFLVSGITCAVPFSQGRAVANYLRSKQMDKMFIVADPDFASSTVAGYLDREVYYVSGDRLGSFVVWDSRCCVKRNQSVLELAQEKSAEQRKDVLAILDYPSRTTDSHIRELATFEGGTVEDENFYVYLITFASP